MPAPCPHCGEPASGDACRSCGAPLTAAGRAAKASARALPADAPMELLDVTSTPRRVVEASIASNALGQAKAARSGEAAAYLALSKSEEAVLHAASRIYAAHVAAGQVTKENAKDLADGAVRTATRMAMVIDAYVQADDEEW